MSTTPLRAINTPHAAQRAAARSASPKSTVRHACLAVAAVFALTVNSGVSANDTELAAAVEQARRGEFSPALLTLQRLARGAPAHSQANYDYITVLNWAGYHDRAIRMAPRVDRAIAPVYVLEALGASARREKMLDESESFYRAALAREPGRLGSQTGLAYTLTDNGRRDDARRLLGEGSESLERRLAQAELADYQRDDTVATAAYDRVLAMAPDNRTALLGKIRTASRMGASHLALDLANKNPGLLTKPQLDDLYAEKTALDIRWAVAAASAEPKSDRWRALDRAIGASDPVAKRFLAGGGTYTTGEQRLLADRVVALTERFRMDEALELYGQMNQTASMTVPVYTRAAAGNAQLYLKQPQAARRSFEQALTDGSIDHNTRMGRFYSLVETEQLREATGYIDGVATAETQRRVTPPSATSLSGTSAQPSVPTTPNSQEIAARNAAANARTYANRPDLAERMLEEVAKDAPGNLETQSSQAAVAWARGRPRDSVAQLTELIGRDSNRANLRAERYGPLMEIGEFRLAQADLTEASARRPEETQVQRTDRLWGLHNRPQLTMDGGYGRSNSANSPSGSRDYRLDSYLYSQPLAYNYRGFVHSYIGQGRFEQGNARWDRLGAGVEYRGRDVRLSGEVNRGIGDSGDTGVALRGRWIPTDHWYLDGRFETQTNDIPLRARLAGYTARVGAVEAGYRVNESRTLAVGAGLMPFSDGNDRTFASASWIERLYADASLKIDGRLGLYASRNTRTDAPYFNPSADFSPELGIVADWLTWRNYQRAFHQRFRASIGGYRQEGFGSGRTTDFGYEHVWEMDDRFSLRYGIGRLLHPYDGRQTGRNYFTLGLDGRF